MFLALKSAFSTKIDRESLKCPEGEGGGSPVLDRVLKKFWGWASLKKNGDSTLPHFNSTFSLWSGIFSCNDNWKLGKFCSIDLPCKSNWKFRGVLNLIKWLSSVFQHCQYFEQ